MVTLKIGSQVFDFTSRAFIMGIINLTPDSFSHDGLCREDDCREKAIRQARQMVGDGADFLDIGAESTRPGAPPVSEAEEGRRLFPVLEALVQTVDVPISIDTYKPEIAAQALTMGATIINDIWGLSAPGDTSQRMARVIAAAGAAVVVMHNQEEPRYQDVVRDVIAALDKSVALAVRAGIDPDKIIIDPGIGFAKSYRDNLRLLSNLDQLRELGKPILLGVSRKSVIGKALNLPVNERLEGTIAANVWGVAKGANIVRVHDVAAISRAIRMCDAIRNE